MADDEDEDEAFDESSPLDECVGRMEEDEEENGCLLLDDANQRIMAHTLTPTSLQMCNKMDEEIQLTFATESTRKFTREVWYGTFTKCNVQCTPDIRKPAEKKLMLYLLRRCLMLRRSKLCSVEYDANGRALRYDEMADSAWKRNFGCLQFINHAGKPKPVISWFVQSEWTIPLHNGERSVADDGTLLMELNPATRARAMMPLGCKWLLSTVEANIDIAEDGTDFPGDEGNLAKFAVYLRSFLTQHHPDSAELGQLTKIFAKTTPNTNLLGQTLRSIVQAALGGGKAGGDIFKRIFIMTVGLVVVVFVVLWHL